MLRTRILVALIALPILIWLIYLPEPLPFFLMALTSLSLALWEVRQLCMNQRLQMSLSIVWPAIVLLGLAAGYRDTAMRLAATDPGAVLWTVLLVVFLALCLRELGFRREPNFMNILAGLFTVVMLGGIGTYVFLLRRMTHGPEWIILLLGFNWLYDAGAFFFGRWLGRTKLAPKISPSKTVEGMLGGLLTNGVGSVLVFYLWLPRSMGFPLWGFVGLSLLLGLLAQAGDLVESLLKRWSGTKDSGGIIPGHGGILDKIDSTLFTAPVLYWVARWMAGV